jgi:hypothetical protein
LEGVILTNRKATRGNPSDFYPTPHNVTIALLQYLQLPLDTIIWEPACGEGHMVKAMQENGYSVIATEKYPRGYGITGRDFLTADLVPCDWIITNPPFSLAEEFIKKCAIHQQPFALLLKSQYWHSQKRYNLFQQYRPSAVLPLTWRPDFLFGAKSGSPTMEVIWTVWDSSIPQQTVYSPLKKPDFIKE